MITCNDTNNVFIKSWTFDLINKGYESYSGNMIYYPNGDSLLDTKQVAFPMSGFPKGNKFYVQYDWNKKGSAYHNIVKSDTPMLIEFIKSEDQESTYAYAEPTGFIVIKNMELIKQF